MLVIDVLNQSELPALTHKVSFAKIVNPPAYVKSMFFNSLNTIQQFRQNGDDYFAITNNTNLMHSRWTADKMIIYKIDNPSQVTCIFCQSSDLAHPIYMDILPSLSDKTIRIQKTQHERKHAITSSVIVYDTESNE